ncbi:hypothetical protein LOTGIDRAFT_231010 [Lottia gigantea]|uniref:Uncharacterized protein n=1 Tax=Lottia gigantea TaxID=225164 RepID=V4AYE3_LOTGI|nr:hypothetical protein LOTGIDRAFT_231010 [Lottia gigantea]ESP00086.1 hypothetical protein LOTGIDRAFT_231010 [Lottia gigantea]
MRELIFLLYCTAIVYTARCQGMGFGEPVPSVGISQNQQDALLALLAPNHHQSGPRPSNNIMGHLSVGNNQNPSSNHQSNTQSSTIGHPGFDMHSLIEMISGGPTGSTGQSSTKRGPPSNVQSNFHDPSQTSSQSGTGFNPQHQSGNQGGYFDIVPEPSQTSNYDPAPSASSGRNRQGSFHDSTGFSLPQPSGSRHNGPSRNSHTQDPMIAALERAQKQPSNSGMNQGNLPGNALPEMFGSHPLSGKTSGNSVFGSLLRNSQSSGHPTGSKQTIHKNPTSSILGSKSGASATSSTSGSLPSGAVSQGSSAPKAFRPPNVFQMKMQAKMYNMKAAKMAPIMQLYEQEGCINPIAFLPANILEGAKSAFSNGCQDPNTKNYCNMAQLKTPGFTPARMNTQILLQSMLTPESKTRIGSMLSKMSPSNMMSGGMSGMMGFGGGEMINAEMLDRVMKLRQRLFPLECNEVVLTSMFKIGTCCYGKVQLPERYIMSQFLSRSFGAK